MIYKIINIEYHQTDRYTDIRAEIVLFIIR